MNWYKKQLDKIANSCISNKTSDIKNLSNILETDFSISLSHNKTKKMIEKFANENQINDSFLNNMIEDFELKIKQNEVQRLKDILIRYSKS
tara:strand:+ start:271 stop:543 length:273 start_codon:yes stop_codon:yes gene_type:complete